MFERLKMKVSSASGLFFVVGVAALGLAVVWVIKIHHIGRLRAGIAGLEQKLAQGQELWRRYPPFKPEEKAALKRAEERFFQGLTRDKDIPSLLQQLSRLALDHGFSDISFSTADSARSEPPGSEPPAVVPKPGAPPPQGASSAVESFPVKMTFTADYRDIAYFLEGLEKLPRMVTVQSVRLERGERFLPGEVVLRAYYQKGELRLKGR